MKNVFRRLAAVTMAGAMLAMPCAGAATTVSVAPTVQDRTDTADSTGKFTIDSAKSGVTLKSGNEYVLLVAKGTYDTTNKTANVTIDASTLTYIDQETATGTSISFDFIPSSKPNSVILLGGEFEGGVTSPVVIGYITSTGETVTIKGSISVVGANGQTLTDIEFKFTSTGGGSSTENVNANGSVQIPADATTIEISRPGYLTLTITNYSGGKDISSVLSEYENCAGDTSGDGRINSQDITSVIRSYGQSTTELPNIDVTRDNRINSQDITVVVRNYGNANKTTSLT